MKHSLIRTDLVDKKRERKALTEIRRLMDDDIVLSSWFIISGRGKVFAHELHGLYLKNESNIIVA